MTITIVEKIYHQSETTVDPYGIEDVFEIPNEIVEEVFSKTYKVKESTTQTIDFGFVEAPGMIHISNKSEEATLHLNAAGVLLSYIPPKASIRLFPPNHELSISSRNGIAKVVISIYPK